MKPRGDSIGRFRIVAVLRSEPGGGSFLAAAPGERRRRVLKWIPAAGGEPLLRSLRGDFLDLASLSHPALAFAAEIGTDPESGRSFILRRHIAGEDMIDALRGRSPRHLLPSFLAAAEALGIVHRAGFLHRNVKPSNLIVPRRAASARAAVSPRVVLCDPAWRPEGAEPSGGEPPRPPGMPRGTVAAFHLDLYALGAVFYRLLTGKRIEPGRGGFPAPPSEVRTGVPLDLDRVVVRLLHPEPSRGYPDAAALIDDLRRISGEPPPDSIPPPECFVDRRAELARTAALLDAGESLAMAITGEAGTGKSAFLQRLALEAQARGFRTLHARCYIESGAPFAPLRTLAESLLAGGSAGGALGRRYRGLLGPAGAERTAPSPGADGRQGLIRGLIELFAAGRSGRPALLLMDDVHLADELTIEFLAALLGEIAAGPSGVDAPPGMAVSFRSEGSFRSKLRPLLEALHRPAPRTLHLELPPLPEEAVEEWIRLAVAGGPCADEVLEAAVRLRGHPLAIREAIRPGGPSPSGPGGDKDPGSIHLDYFTALDREQRRLLEMLAVLGRPAPPDLLGALLRSRTPRSKSLIGALQRQGILVDEKGSVYFRHGSFHGWLRGRLSPAERRRLHERIAGVLERRGGAAREIAAHWLESEDPRRGIDAALAAARELAAVHDHRGALEFYRAALDLLPARGRERKREVALEAAEVHGRASEYRRGAELLLPMLRDTADEAEAGRLNGRIGLLLHRAGDVAPAALYLEKGLALLEPRSSPGLLPDILRIESELAEISSNKGDYENAEGICQRALERVSREPARRKEPEIRREEMVLLETLAHLRLRSFRYRDARELFEKSLKLGEGLGAVREAGLILNNLGTLHVNENRFAQAIDCFHRAAKLSERLGDDPSLVVLHSNLAVTHAKAGEPDAADAALALAARREARCDSRRTRFLRLHSAGLVDLLLGRYGSAIDNLESAIALGEDLKDRFMVAFDRAFLGECRLMRGEFKAARAVFARVEETAGGLPAPAGAMVAARKALLAALKGDAREANESLADCSRRAYGEIPLVEAWNRLYCGWANRLLGRGGEARADLDRARAFFARVKLPAGEIHADLELAAADADARRLDAAGKRLGRLRRRFTIGRGPLKNPMLSARLLAYEGRILLDRGSPDLEQVVSLLVEAESFLIGRGLRDLEALVRELKRRIRLASIGSRDAPALPAAEEREMPANIEAADSIQEAAADLVRRLEEEAGEERTAELHRLLRELQERLREARRRRERRDPAPSPPLGAEAIAGRSAAIREVIELIRKVAPSRLPVLISGETGTGKELVARAIHGESPRRSSPFLSVNCAALPEPLLEAELFGYARGAFSGAEEDRAGLLLKAQGGTFLFDGISEMPPSLQGKLLRFLDRGSVRPLGSTEEMSVEARCLFSTGRRLEDLVEEGKLRADLFHRLRGFEIRVPPLRDRLDDLPILVERFRRLAGKEGEPPAFDEEARRTLAAYSWPGNVRELENTVTLLVLTRTGRVTAADVRSVLGNAPRAGIFTTAQLRSRPLEGLLAQLEKEYLLQLHGDLGGDLKTMAARLGITLRALYSRFHRLGIDPRGLKGRAPE